MGNSFLSGRKHEKTENMRYGGVFGRAAIVSALAFSVEEESNALSEWFWITDVTMLDYGIATEKPIKNNIVYSPFIEGIFFKNNKNHIVALFSHFGFFVFSVCFLSTDILLDVRCNTMICYE